MITNPTFRSHRSQPDPAIRLDGRRFVRPLAVALALSGCLGTTVQPTPGQGVVELAYSFADQDSGGAAVVKIEVASGRILDTRPLFDSADCRDPLKIRRTTDNRRAVVTNLAEKGPHLFLWSADAPDTAQGLSLPSVPDEVRLVNGLALVTLEKDAVAAVDLAANKMATVRQLDELLTPPANAPEDLTVDPDQDYAVVSFQKDSKTGKKRGNRLVVFNLPELRPIADLPLPRERPELHIAGNLKEQGPGPEVLHISPETDTLAVTLDLYGALGMVRWSAAKSGRLDENDWTMVSTSDNAEINGRSFPDRATPVSWEGRQFYLICNAGVDGGSVLVDLARRQVVWRRKSPPGLEAPIYVPELRQAFSVCSGKTKRRTAQDVVKEYHPLKSLFVFDFRSQEALDEAPLTSVPLGGYTTQIALASPSPPLLVATIGQRPERADTLVTIDPVTRTIKDRRPAVGIVGRLER